MSSDDEQIFSIWLSSRMRQAGFTAANARVQSAMAAVLQDILRFLLKSDRVHVFGSFADGWGSCLTRLDGRVDRDSDIDVTMITEVQPLHPTSVGAPECKPSSGHRLVEYQDGHLNCPNDVPGPNIAISRSDILPAIDVIIAVPCCSYPPIELLQSGHSSHIPDRILQALSQEIFQSPRCHAVAASPPGLERSRMRVSTTLLERLVMHNLTTVQGQFFVLVKFLIKRVISARVTGLKTYMAKNLLFYMLDDTLEDDWQPQNLLALVRQSLQILAAMMESTSSDSDSGEHVCMAHFFLRDASVYLKKNHRSKLEIVAEIGATSDDLRSLLLIRFAASLPESEVNAVHFHAFLLLFFLGEFVESESQASELGAYEMVWDAHIAVSKEVSGTSAEQHLNTLLRQINELPDCFRLSRECLRVAAYLKTGSRLEDAADGQFEFAVSRGIRSPADANGDSLLSVDEAKSNVLGLLQEVLPIRLRVSNGRVSGFMMEREFSAVAQLFKIQHGAQFPRKEDILIALMEIPQCRRFFMTHKKIFAQLRQALEKGTRHIVKTLLGFAGAASAPSADETPPEAPPLELDDDTALD